MAQSPKQSAPNRRQYDTVSKTLIQQNPKDWVAFSLGTPDVEVVRVLETQQPTVKSNQVDSFIHVNIGGKEGIMHLEMQTYDSRVEQDSVAKADYLTDLAILGGLIFEYSTVREIIMEAIMQESSVIQHFVVPPLIRAKIP